MRTEWTGSLPYKLWDVVNIADVVVIKIKTRKGKWSRRQRVYRDARYIISDRGSVSS
jgi:hypothetical protein